MSQTAILGAGVMGETLLSGLVRAGRRVDNLLVGEKRPERAAELEERYGVAVVSNVEAARKADTVALVVKPQDMADLLEEIAAELRPGQLVVSLAAGITTAFIESRVPEGVAVVRVMPNTPALVDEGMAAISPGSHCDDSHLAEAEALMGSIGRVVRVPERQQDAVTAISGSGPAYIFFVVESMIEAGVHLGLPRATASELVVQTLVGSAKMLRETGTHPDRAARAGHLAGRHHRRRAARARDPQGARRVPRRHGGRPRPLPRAGRGLLTHPATSTSGRSDSRVASDVARVSSPIAAWAAASTGAVTSRHRAAPRGVGRRDVRRVGGQLGVALLHRLEHRDHRVGDRRLEGAVRREAGGAEPPQALEDVEQVGDARAWRPGRRARRPGRCRSR